MVNFERLPAHLCKIIGENFKRDRFGFYFFQDCFGKDFVIGQTDFSHQGRICREAVNVWLTRKLCDSLKIGAVREDLHGQVQQAFSHPFQPTQRSPRNASSSQRLASRRTALTASLKFATVKSGDSRKGSL